MIKKILTISFLFACIHQSMAQTRLPDNIKHLQVQRLTDTYIDMYISNIPVNKKLPVLIFCQGSGYDSNTEGFLGLSDLYKNDAAGLVIEKPGVNYGDAGDTLRPEYKEYNTIYNRLYDYLRVLQYLKANAGWWNGDVYVVGGSEGGLMAGLLASFYPNVKAVAILCFGGGLNFGEAWPIASGLQKKADGGDNAAIQKEEVTVRDSLQYIRKHGTYLQSYSGEDNTYAWWASVVDLRLSNVLIDLNIPIFIGQGSEDLAAPPVSAQKLNEIFIQKGKTNLYYKEYKGYDHGFTDANGKSHLVEVFVEALNYILGKK